MTIIDRAAPVALGTRPTSAEVAEHAAAVTGTDPTTVLSPNRPRTEIQQASPRLVALALGAVLSTGAGAGFVLGVTGELPNLTVFILAAILGMFIGVLANMIGTAIRQGR